MHLCITSSYQGRDGRTVSRIIITYIMYVYPIYIYRGTVCECPYIEVLSVFKESRMIKEGEGGLNK